MVNAVKMDVEEESGHLAESEVARLLAVLQNAEFKRSETRNITKDHSFKPRSLMEIAIEAQHRDAEIETVKQAEESRAAAQRTDGLSAGKAQVGGDQDFADPDTLDLISANPNLDNQDLETGGNDGALMPADGSEHARLRTGLPDSPPPPISEANPDVKSNKTSNMLLGDQSSDVIDNRANDALATDASERDPIADNGEDDAELATEIATNFETVTAAFDRGKAEGMITGRDAGITETKAAAEAAAQANLADKIATFEAALTALAKPQALQAEDLSKSIHAAILKLASQRAGQQIDEMPESFLGRIEALVTSIGQKMTAGKVHINEDDYKVMLPYLANTHFDFVAEPKLARGDVILKFAGVELHDIAETRLGGQYAETATTMVEALKEPADLTSDITPDEIPPAETARDEITPPETTPAEAADVFSPVQNADDAETDSPAVDNSKGDQSSFSSDETL